MLKLESFKNRPNHLKTVLVILPDVLHTEPRHTVLLLSFSSTNADTMITVNKAKNMKSLFVCCFDFYEIVFSLIDCSTNSIFIASDNSIPINDI